jgi:hypothetical protein
MGLTALTKAAVEGFTSSSNSKERRNAYVDFISFLLAFILSMVILGFVGKLLWNEVIVELVSVAKPARSVWHIIGLMLFTTLMIPK